MKVLFVGNSATYVHDIPGTLSRLAQKAGYEIETSMIAPGGAELAKHADLSTEHGRLVQAELENGYDIVFLQDNGNCISTDEKRISCANASKVLIERAKASGSKVYFYVRPPYGKESWGYTAFEQCKAFDELFGVLARENDIGCVYANRAYAYAIKNLDCNLWREDNAHTSVCGAYLIVCVFFAFLFNVSAEVLDNGTVEPELACALKKVADKIVFEGCEPWND